MSTEWSTDTHDTPRSGSGTSSPEWMANRSEAEVSADGEGEMHRSAVEAVDGLLDEVELALARLDDGTYGRCEECGEPIDDGRLAALPIIRTCGRCDPDAGTGPDSPPGAPAVASGTADPVEPAIY